MPEEAAWKSLARERADALRFPMPKFAPEPHPSLNSLQQRLARQKAMFRWAADLDPEFHVVVKFNDSLDERQIRKRLGLLDALLDRYWLGKTWAAFPSDQRTFFIAFVESDHAKLGVHAHLLLRRPPKVERPSMADWRGEAQRKFLSIHFTEAARRKGISPRGDILFQRIPDQEQAASYGVKDFSKEWNSRNGFILSDEFHSKAKSLGPGRNAAGRSGHLADISGGVATSKQRTTL